MVSPAVEMRAARSHGISNDAILRMVARALETRDVAGGCLVDVGCGEGHLYEYIGGRFSQYVGLDAVRYDDFPASAEFRQVDLDSGRLPLPDGTADVVAAVEVIEHLENPRDFLRKLVRLTKPRGWVVVTTPNQLSLLSLLTLVVKQRFQAFQDVHYPAHLTALLEVDLRRIAAEIGLANVSIEYSLSGRIVFTALHYPGLLAQRFPRAFSDNVLLIGQKAE